MKTLRFQISITMVVAIGVLTFNLNTIQADPLKRFGRFMHSGRDSDDVTSRTVQTSQVHRPVQPAPVPPGYPRYQLIDLGTLGGPNSGVWGAPEVNNRGEVVAQLGTPLPDPYTPNCFNFDCFVWVAAVREPNGVVINLGALPSVNNSVPVWITENGLVAGLSQNGLIDPHFDFPVWRAVLWNRDHSMLDLGTFGGLGSAAYSVNSRGQAVGVAANTIEENPDFASFVAVDFPSATQARAFLWENGSMQDLGTLGGNDASASNINERGQIVGSSYTDTTPNDTTGVPTIHPFLWENGTMRDVGSLGGTLSIPGGISYPATRVLNDSGDIVGTSTLPGDEDWHAFVYTRGTIIDIGTLGGNLSDALAINNKGQVVGRARTTNQPNSHHPFLWEQGRITDLGLAAPCTRGTALSINAQGEVIGGFGGCGPNPDDRTFFRGFYWQKGKPIVDLNSLIAPASDIWIDLAAFINDRGQILAIGILPDGSEHAVLLVPIANH